MTLADDGKFCHRCKKIGLKRKAHRIMPSGGAVCDEHYREEAGLPQLDSERKAFIESCREKEQVNRETVQRKKSKTVHQQNRKSPEQTGAARSPDVRSLLDAFHRKV